MARLIVFEGIDGSGKTTLSKMLAAELSGRGLAVRWLREPTDSPSGERIRRLARTRRAIPAAEELNYFLEDRRFDVAQNIRPALAAGITVVMDRYFYSNACYQAARGLKMAGILAQNRAFAPEADLVFLIDVDPQIALARIARTKRRLAPLFERKPFLEKVRANYLRLGRRQKNLIVIPGDDGLAAVYGRVIAAYDRATAPERP